MTHSHLTNLSLRLNSEARPTLSDDILSAGSSEKVVTALEPRELYQSRSRSDTRSNNTDIHNVKAYFIRFEKVN